MQVSDTSKSVSSLSTIKNEQYHIPVRSAVKSNLTAWCCQNLYNRALNALTVQASGHMKISGTGMQTVAISNNITYLQHLINMHMYAYAESSSKYFEFVWRHLSCYLHFLIKKIFFLGRRLDLTPILKQNLSVFKKVVWILCATAPVYTLRVPLLAEKQTSSEWA